MCILFNHGKTCVNLKTSELVATSEGSTHAGTLRYRDASGMWAQAGGAYMESVLDILGVKNCSAPTSPKLDKVQEGQIAHLTSRSSASRWRGLV